MNRRTTILITLIIIIGLTVTLLQSDGERNSGMMVGILVAITGLAIAVITKKGK